MVVLVERQGQGAELIIWQASKQANKEQGAREGNGKQGGKSMGKGNRWVGVYFIEYVICICK